MGFGIMAATWTNEETIKLLELWGEEETQAVLEGCARNKHIYEKIVRGMVEAGYERPEYNVETN